MASLINELEDVLSNQLLIYQELLNTSREKKDIIVKNDIDALREILIIENQLVGKNQKLEKNRIELFYDISMVLGKPKNSNLTQILEGLQGQPEQARISECREKILEIVDELKKINDENQNLLELSASYVEFNINTMSSANTPQTFYDSSGNPINSSEYKMFDAKQ